MYGLCSNIQSLLDNQSELNEPKRPLHLQMHLEIFLKKTQTLFLSVNSPSSVGPCKWRRHLKEPKQQMIITIIVLQQGNETIITITDPYKEKKPNNLQTVMFVHSTLNFLEALTF